MKRAVRAAARLGAGAAERLRARAAVRPPSERSVLDDLVMRRPWNVTVKVARLAARSRLSWLMPGITVIIVNWNTRDITADTIRAVVRLSPPGTTVFVVDNGSSDGSRPMLRRWDGLRKLLLPANAGHGVALDLAVCLTRTTVAVTLDSDALPLTPDWLTPATEPVLAGRAMLAGLRATRGFVHPVYAAVDVRAFVARKLSFQVHRVPGAAQGAERWGEDAWDTGELMTNQLGSGAIAFVERTPNLVAGLKGMTAGAVVYHHGGVSRSASGEVTSDELAAWRAACRRLDVLDPSGEAPDRDGERS